MFVVTVPQDRMADKDGFITPSWANFFDQLVQNMQQNLSSEGFVIPNQSNANMMIIQNGRDMNGNQIVELGTVLYNTDINKLYVLLDDGTFHPITTT